MNGPFFFFFLGINFVRAFFEAVLKFEGDPNKFQKRFFFLDKTIMNFSLNRH